VLDERDRACVDAPRSQPVIRRPNHPIATRNLRSRRWTAILLLGAIVGGASTASAASLDLRWTAPSTNADGTPLTDLAGYRVYVATGMPPCPAASFQAVASPTTTPTGAETITLRLASLTAGTTYFSVVTAVDGAGNESACTSAVSGVARADLAVSPAGSVSFGTTATGTAVDATFTVQNATGAGLTGAVSVGAPFSVVAGGTFTLAAGASQPVVVRFRSSTAGSFASNVTFTANGDTLSRTVTATAVAAVADPTLSITRTGTGSGTVTSVPAGIACGTDCTETVAAGTQLTLTATAAAGSSFAGWSGGGCSVTATTCTVSVSANTTVTATFNAVTLAAPSGSTTGTPTVTTVSTTPSEIVIDNAQPGVQDLAGGRTFTGRWCLASARDEFGPTSLKSCGRRGDTYRWTPTIPVAGTYDVYVWLPTASVRSTSVPIVVAHAGGTTTRLFNERRAPGTWVLHGRYAFNAGTAGYVQTSDRYGTAAADAIRLVPVR
jgi:hypothetical protein